MTVRVLTVNEAMDRGGYDRMLDQFATRHDHVIAVALCQCIDDRSDQHDGYVVGDHNSVMDWIENYWLESGGSEEWHYHVIEQRIARPGTVPAVGGAQ